MIPDAVHVDLEDQVSGKGSAGCYCYFSSDLTELTNPAIKVKQGNSHPIIKPNMAGEGL